jgi:lysophospholipase L1-like esterase
MSFRDYSLTPASNTELADGTYVGPNMLRNKVRPAIQQLMADGKELATYVDTQISIYDAALSSLAGSESRFRTKADALASLAAIDDGAFIYVFVDESKNDTWSVYQKVGLSLEYVFSIATTSAEASVLSDGVLFDTARTDHNFNQLIYTGSAELTVSTTDVAFNSAALVNQVMEVPSSDGVTPLYYCFDHWEVDATFTVNAFTTLDGVGANGVEVGGRYYVPSVADGIWGMEIIPHPSSTSSQLALAITGGSLLEYTASNLTAPKTVRVRYRHNLTTNTVTHIANFDGGADVSLTEPYGSGAYVPPISFVSPAIRWLKGNMVCTALKFSADYPNAKYAIVGDSNAVSTTTPRSDGYAHRLRVDYPDDVLLAAAGGTTTTDWVDMIESVTLMKPRYAFVCLGVNDFILTTPLATVQANYTEIVEALIDADIIPIVLATPPHGNANVPLLNAWLADQDWRFIDIYAALKNPASTALAAANDSGDGIHWNATGHDVVYDMIAAYITAQAL